MLEEFDKTEARETQSDSRSGAFRERRADPEDVRPQVSMPDQPGGQAQDNTHELHPAQPRLLGSTLKKGVSQVNKELWLILSMLGLAAALNFLFTGHHMILGFFTFPTIFAAFFYGRRHATLTAFASVFLVGFLARINPNILGGPGELGYLQGRWYDIVAWGGILVVTAYAMGTLHELHRSRLRELKLTYNGLLVMLHQIVSKDKYTESHSYRVSLYASKIASYLRLRPDQIEDVRAASLIHDLGNVKTSRDLLQKAASLTEAEYHRFQKQAEKGSSLLEPVGGRIHRIIPIILAHMEKAENKGAAPARANDVPLEARILAVADAYDALTSDGPYRRGVSPFDAKESILKAAGSDFDSEVVQAFIAAFRENEMELSEPVTTLMS
jgi:5'-deoxynucleotidase YfbR-like HD superfamily hydrolase